LRQARGEDFAGLRIAQGHTHAAHAGADELAVIAEHAHDDLGRLGLRRDGGEEGEAKCEKGEDDGMDVAHGMNSTR
jgi:hypothetical protein